MSALLRATHAMADESILRRANKRWAAVWNVSFSSDRYGQVGYNPTSGGSSPPSQPKTAIAEVMDGYRLQYLSWK